jgi:hypothetical protein
MLVTSDSQIRNPKSEIPNRIPRALRLHPFLLLLLVRANAVAGAEGWLQKAAQKDIVRFDGTNIERPEDETRDRRGKVVMRRVKPQCKSDWNNDPTALPYLFYQLNERTQGKFPTYVDNEGIELTGEEIFDYPLLYFTSHWEFQFSDAEVENLKKFLARGGTLLLDDCTGSGPFMDSVPANVQRIVPGAELKLMLRDTTAYADLFNLIYKVERMPPLKEQFMQPFQCADVNGRPAILVCPNDYGCSWEVASPPTALNPLGNPAHADPTPTVQMGREEVYQLSINWLFYALTH